MTREERHARLREFFALPGPERIEFLGDRAPDLLDEMFTDAYAELRRLEQRLVACGLEAGGALPTKGERESDAGELWAPELWAFLAVKRLTAAYRRASGPCLNCGQELGHCADGPVCRVCADARIREGVAKMPPYLRAAIRTGLPRRGLRSVPPSGNRL